MRTSVIVRFTFEAIHHWPEAPHNMQWYLRYPHRHLFHVEAKKEVTHDDRQIEFIELCNRMRSFCQTSFGPVSHGGVVKPLVLSCEMIARVLLEHFELKTCEVTEDGENGAEVER